MKYSFFVLILASLSLATQATTLKSEFDNLLNPTETSRTSEHENFEIYSTEISQDEFHKGENVFVSPYNQYVKFHGYTHAGRVVLKVDWADHEYITVPSENVFKTVSEYGGFKAGEKVFGKHTIVKIKKISANGYAKMFNDFLAGDSIVHVSKLSKLVPELDGFKVNDRVIALGHKGRIKGIDASGKVLVKFPLFTGLIIGNQSYVSITEITHAD